MKTRKKRNTNKRNFTNKDYNSNDGMLTRIWGPGLWHSLHTISFNYPVKPRHCDKVQYRNFVLSLANILPCGKCRVNFHNNLKQLPLTMNKMKSRHTFSRYMYDLHEVINKMLGKKSNLSYSDIRERYEHFRARCKTEKNHDIKSEKGCIEPLNGKKKKCVLTIVPDDKKCATFSEKK
tara:strand:- start:4565 stop:5098 length:534 start_codon:yes stop_codon:yes gene_type:complete